MEAKARAGPRDSHWVSMLLTVAVWHGANLYCQQRWSHEAVHQSNAPGLCVNCFSSTHPLKILPKDGQCLKTGTQCIPTLPSHASIGF